MNTASLPTYAANSNTASSLSCVESAAAIRRELKTRYGWTSRDVSVKSDVYSMGSSLRVLIKNPAVSVSKVREVANEYERVRYDEASGEILSGGNRFLDVDYARDVVNAISVPMAAKFKMDGAAVRVGPYRVYRDMDQTHGEYFRAYNPEGDVLQDVSCHGAEFCARQLTEKMLDLGVVWEVV